MDFCNYSFAFLYLARKKWKTPWRWISSRHQSHTWRRPRQERNNSEEFHWKEKKTLKRQRKRKKMGRKSAPLGIMLSNKQDFSYHTREQTRRHESLTGKWISAAFHKINKQWKEEDRKGIFNSPSVFIAVWKLFRNKWYDRWKEVKWF